MSLVFQIFIFSELHFRTLVAVHPSPDVLHGTTADVTVIGIAANSCQLLWLAAFHILARLSACSVGVHASKMASSPKTGRSSAHRFLGYTARAASLLTSPLMPPIQVTTAAACPDDDV